MLPHVQCFLNSPLCASGLLACTIHASKNLCWCHLMMSSLHVSSHASPSHVIIHVIRWCQPYHSSNPWPKPELTRKPEFDLNHTDRCTVDCPLTLTVHWPLTLTRFNFGFCVDFDQKLKFQKMPILLSFSHRFRFWIPFLHLKLQNWSIGTFFIVVSSKVFYKASPSDLLMLIQPQAFIELPSWVWGRVLEIYILDILAQCNIPKTPPAYTSSLGFSHLYILMLEFIVTQVIVLHSYIIKM